jgi:heat shock protein HtpX
MRLMFDEVRNNERQSLFILFLFIIFALALFLIATLLFTYDPNQAQPIFNEQFFFIYSIFVAVTLGYVLFFLSQGDKMVLNLTGAKPVTREDYPHLYHTVEGLAIAAGIPPPKAYVIDDSALNAFATGFKPDKSAIVVTTGLMQKLNRQELEGVVAHEMAHIKNKDVKVMLYVAGLIGVFTLLGTFFYYMSFTRSSSDRDGRMQLIGILGWVLFSIIGVLFGTLFKLALSRKREFMADANGAVLTRYPKGLADALRKIKGDPDPLVDKASNATAHMFISTPFRKKSGVLTGLFATHPPIDERIKRLEEM